MQYPKKDLLNDHMKKNNLIFDLGFHNGDDTDFYLRKGFNVVAVEADPRLVKKGITRFKSFINNKRLILINRAVSDKTGVEKFYINLKRSDWSSCNKALAESDGSRSKVVSVESITLNKLCDDFGTPRYVKVDVEGKDVAVARQLYELKDRPQYISFETSRQTYAGLFSWLYISGYNKFQLVNQLNNHFRKMGDYSKSGEGKKINYKFSKYSSGFFGKDLPSDGWLSYDDALTRYLKYKELKVIDNKELAIGWLDLHASL